MSVSDPLLKSLKSHVLLLRMTPPEVKITDRHPSLQPLCETLENILRKGLRQSPTFLKLSSPRDYWDVFRHLSDLKQQQQAPRQQRQPHQQSPLPPEVMISPKFDLAMEDVRQAKYVVTQQGRARLAIRSLLFRNQFSWFVDAVVHKTGIVCLYYDDLYSILGNEILAQILLSLLRELDLVHFHLDLRNSAFLDYTWLLPDSRAEQFVPCRALGLDLVLLNDFLVVELVRPGSVAEEDNRIVVGDILEELCGVCLKGNVANLRDILKAAHGRPITCRIIKAIMPPLDTIDMGPPTTGNLLDGDFTAPEPQRPQIAHNVSTTPQLYPPLVNILRMNGRDDLLQKCRSYLPKSSVQDLGSHAHALGAPMCSGSGEIPDDIFPEDIPPQGANMSPYYIARFVGECFIGSEGGVQKIEGGVSQVLRTFSDPRQFVNVRFYLGEKDVRACRLDTGEEVLNHAFPRISSCGRRLDCTRYFAYIAGESTCTISKEFHCFVFQARNEEESRKILCAIAQGFERTHWAL